MAVEIRAGVREYSSLGRGENLDPCDTCGRRRIACTLTRDRNRASIQGVRDVFVTIFFFTLKREKERTRDNFSAVIRDGTDLRIGAGADRRDFRSCEYLRQGHSRSNQSWLCSRGLFIRIAFCLQYHLDDQFTFPDAGETVSFPRAKCTVILVPGKTRVPASGLWSTAIPSPISTGIKPRCEQTSVTPRTVLPVRRGTVTACPSASATVVDSGTVASCVSAGGASARFRACCFATNVWCGSARPFCRSVAISNSGDSGISCGTFR